MSYYKLLLLHLQINGMHVTAKLAWLVHTLIILYQLQMLTLNKRRDAVACFKVSFCL
jgi:hypothetical protein